MSVDFAKGGRTKKGRESAQAHTLDPWTNLIDGMEQEGRKKAVAERQRKPHGKELDGDEQTDRIVGVSDFAADVKKMISEAGGEKFPGLGTLLVYDVGPHREAAQELSPKESFARLAELHETCFYERRRSDRPASAPAQKVRPGLIKKTLPVPPWYDASVKRSLTEGLSTAEEVKELLRGICWMLGQEIPQATKIGGASAGVVAEFVAVHLQQGCLHFHPYIRDVDSSTHQRIGLFTAESKKEVGRSAGRPRLVLNGLGVGALTQLALKGADMPAVPKLFVNTGKSGQGAAYVTVIEGWQILDAALAHRRAKGLGECWDEVVAAKIHEAMEAFLSEGPRRAILEEEKARCRDRYEAERVQAEAEIAKLTGRTERERLTSLWAQEKKKLQKQIAELEKKQAFLSLALDEQIARNADLVHKANQLDARLNAMPAPSLVNGNGAKTPILNFGYGVDALERIRFGNADLADFSWLSSDILNQATSLSKAKSPSSDSARAFLQLRSGLKMTGLKPIVGKVNDRERAR